MKGETCMTRNEMCKKIVLKWNEDDGQRGVDFKELENGKVSFKEFIKRSDEIVFEDEFDSWQNVFKGYVDEMGDWEATEGEDAFRTFQEEERQFIMNEIKKNDLSYEFTNLCHEIGKVYKDDKLNEMLDNVYCYMWKEEGVITNANGWKEHYIEWCKNGEMEVPTWLNDLDGRDLIKAIMDLTCGVNLIEATDEETITYVKRNLFPKTKSHFLNEDCLFSCFD